MIYYTVYKVTNNVNGKVYIGSHKTNDLNDNYMGSGKYLKYAQKKYGVEKFNKVILFIFDTPELMYEKEAEIVNKDFLVDENTYNLRIGGFGGFDYINQSSKNLYGNNGRTPNVKGDFARGRETHRLRKEADPAYASMVANKISVALFGRVGPMTGKRHTAEAKRIIGDNSSKSQLGIRNSQYGKMWITDGIINMKILKDGVISNGWRKGRVINKKNGNAGSRQ